MPAGDRSARRSGGLPAAIAPAGRPPPPTGHGWFAPDRWVGHGRRQLVISMPLMVSLVEQPTGGFGRPAHS